MKCNVHVFAGFPGLCACCPMKPPGLDQGGAEQRSSSVAELRRKAQEHSAALLQSLQQVASFQQQAAAAALHLPLPLPSLSTLHALARKADSAPQQLSPTSTSAPVVPSQQS